MVEKQAGCDYLLSSHGAGLASPRGETAVRDPPCGEADISKKNADRKHT